MNHKVFVSFSSRDLPLAEKIYDRLERHGIPSWISSRNIPPGGDYQACIVEAIQAAEVIVLVFSSSANTSAEIAKELSLASTKLVIPVRIEDVVPEGAFRYQISNRQFYDVFEDFDRRLEGLCLHVKAVLDGKVSALPTAPVAPAKSRSARRGGAGLMLGALAAMALIAASLLFWRSTRTADASATQSAGSPTKPAPATNAGTPGQASEVGGADGGSSVSGAVASAGAQTAPSAEAQAFAGLLAGTQGYSRFQAIDGLKSRVPRGLTAEDAVAILADTGSDRGRSLDVLAPSLVTDLDGPAAAKILAPLTGYSRYVALETLSDAGKLRRDMTSADAVAVLAGMESDQTRAIGVLAPLLQTMGGADVAKILQGTTAYARYTALKEIVDAGKLRPGINSDEINAITSEMESDKPRALALLAGGG